SWNPERWPLRQHLRLFEVEPWDEQSTFRLAVHVVCDWWRNAPSDTTANTVMSALLDRIALRPSGSLLFAAMDRVLEKGFGLDVLTYRRARAALDAWERARELRS